MTSKYEIVVDKEVKSCRFYLVHAATKFTFRFRNTREGAVRVRQISVSNTADKMYVMPHKIEQNMDFREPDGSTMTSLYWVDWLQRVAEESEANPDNPLNTQLAEGRGWIMDYDIPAGTTHGTVDLMNGTDVSVPTTTGGYTVVGPFYRPESQNLKSSINGPYSEQTYKVKFQVRDNYNRTRTLEVEFKNLKALFRNTHVVMDVLLGETVIIENVQYTVCPWLNYTINVPTFE